VQNKSITIILLVFFLTIGACDKAQDKVFLNESGQPLPTKTERPESQQVTPETAQDNSGPTDDDPVVAPKPKTALELSKEASLNGSKGLLGDFDISITGLDGDYCFQLVIINAGLDGIYTVVDVANLACNGTLLSPGSLVATLDFYELGAGQMLLSVYDRNANQLISIGEYHYEQQAGDSYFYPVLDDLYQEGWTYLLGL